MADLSFSSDALHTAAQYMDEAATCTKVTPPAGDDCSRVYAQRISKPILALNEEDKRIQAAMKETQTNILATIQSFEAMERDIADSIASALKEDNPW